MTGAQEPLLQGSNDGINAAVEAAADVARRLEAGLSADEGAVDFEDLLKNDPDHVIEYLENHGTTCLGAFVTDDTEVLPLIRDGTIWTLGAETMDLDYERLWRHYLACDQYKARGFATKVEVEAHVLTIKNAALPDDRGILNPLLEKWQDGALSTKVFGLPAVQAVITYKWDRWARRVLLFEFLFYLVWLLGFQIFIILFQDEDLDLSMRQLAHTARGAVTIGALAVSTVGMLPFLYIEACTLAEYGPARWFNIWNSLDLATYVLQVVIAVMYFTRHDLASELLSVLTASQVILLYWKIQYYARAFQPLKNSFVDTLRAVIIDVRWFLLLLVITLWGFAGAFYILFRTEQGTMFENYWHSLLTLFSFMLGGFDLDFFYKSRNPLVGITLLLGFVFSMSLVLLNCLIAIMSDAATKADDKDGTKYLCSKAQLIDELETSLPAWVRKPDWYPPFIHILKVNPESLQKVKGGVWAVNTAEEEVQGGDDSQDVKQQITELQGQVTRLEALLKRALGDKLAVEA